MSNDIPGNVIKRLALYHYILNDYLSKKIEHISSAQISTLLKMDDSQVRKDISLCQTTGKTNVGYNVIELKKCIEYLLGFKDRKTAFIIGAGNLGCALAKQGDFKDFGLEIIAMFDNNPLKIDTVINNKPVLPISTLALTAPKRKVEIALLTVPREAAQEAADIIVQAKIKYIWNFTSAILAVPDDVKVCNENLMGNFLEFTNN